MPYPPASPPTVSADQLPVPARRPLDKGRASLAPPGQTALCRIQPLDSRPFALQPQRYQPLPQPLSSDGSPSISLTPPPLSAILESRAVSRRYACESASLTGGGQSGHRGGSTRGSGFTATPKAPTPQAHVPPGLVRNIGVYLPRVREFVNSSPSYLSGNNFHHSRAAYKALRSVQ